MARKSQPTLSDDRQTEESQLQFLWAELGPSALYYINGSRGDCMEIEIRVARDLMKGVPYNADIRLEVAFVRESAEAANAAVDELLREFTENDEECDSGDRVTLIPSDRPPSSLREPDERLDVSFVHIQVVAHELGHRLLLVRPVIDLPPSDGRRWQLEIRVTKYDLVRRVSPSSSPLIPRPL